MTTPTIGAPEWAANHESPWLGWNKASRMFDGFAFRTTVLDRDLTAPPVTCADGARYLVAAGATGEWVDKDGHLAIAYGANAALGWLFVPLEIVGTSIWVEDEAVDLTYYAGAWNAAGAGVSRIQDLDDVDIAGIADGQTLKYDASYGKWVAADEIGDTAVGFRGALVRKAANQTTADFTSDTYMTWDSEVYDTSGIHDNVTNNSRLTVPSGISRIRLQAQVSLDLVALGQTFRIRIDKNGSPSYDGTGEAIVEGAVLSVQIINVSTGIISVSPGDYFEVNIRAVETDNSVTVTAAKSWFAMEIIE